MKGGFVQTSPASLFLLTRFLFNSPNIQILFLRGPMIDLIEVSAKNNFNPYHYAFALEIGCNSPHEAFETTGNNVSFMSWMSDRWTEVKDKLGVDTNSHNSLFHIEMEKHLQSRLNNLNVCIPRDVKTDFEIGCCLYIKNKVLEKFTGLKQVHIHRRKGAYCLTKSLPLSLDSIIAIEGNFWFGTLKDMDNALNKCVSKI